MKPQRCIIRIDADELAQAVLELVDGTDNVFAKLTSGGARFAFAAAIVERAKRRGSIEVDFGEEREA